MRVLLVGSGGREHALALALVNSASLTDMIVAPGNPGMAEIARLADVKADDVAGLVALAVSQRIDLVVVGPETALAAGLTDALAARQIPCFGPTRAAAQLESSKAFTKAFCARHNISTAAFETFSEVEPALAYLDHFRAPYVIKASGLAAGKGVVIAESLADARAAVREIFSGKFGDAGEQVVIEEFMIGEEVSLFALCDGTNAVYFGSAQDHKRAYDGDKGPNTGGMGAYSPTALATPEFVDFVMETVIQPTLQGMVEEGMPFRGVLFAGLMLTPTGPRLIEYNVRFGDPECQVLMARFEGDLAGLLYACARGDVRRAPGFTLSNQSAAVVVMAAQGYPDVPIAGSPIRGEAVASAIPNGVLLHAGTKRDEDGLLRAAGGRVLNAVGVGPDIGAALDTAYAIVDAIHWPMSFCRRDIGWRELARGRG